MTNRDKSFTRNLISTTLRYRGQIDKLLEYCCNSDYPPQIRKKKGQGRSSNRRHKMSKTEYTNSMIQSCLRIGVTQLVFLDTPAHAGTIINVQNV